MMLTMNELNKNQILTAVIDGWSADGAGVCHVSGRAILSPRHTRRNVGHKNLKGYLGCGLWPRSEPACPLPARVTPECPYFGKCGGCDTWHTNYDEELKFKLGRVNDALRHVGGQQFEATRIVGCDHPIRYRNKGIYAVMNISGRVQAGFYRERSHDLVPVDSCLIQNELADRTAKCVTDWMNKNAVPAYDETTGRGTVRHIYTRRATHTDDAVLCIVSARGFGDRTQALVDSLRADCPELTGIVLCVNKSRGMPSWMVNSSRYGETSFCAIPSAAFPLSFRPRLFIKSIHRRLNGYIRRLSALLH